MSVDAELWRRLHLPGGTPAEVGVAALDEDEDGNLWLGTPNSGLQRVRQQTVTTYSRAHGLLDRTTYAIFQDRSGAIWIGGWDRGLTRYETGSSRASPRAMAWRTG